MYPSLISVYSQTMVRALVSIILRRIITFNQSSIKNTMSKDYFYSKDEKIEDALCDIERYCMWAFHKLVDNPNYNSHEVERLNI